MEKAVTVVAVHTHTHTHTHTIKFIKQTKGENAFIGDGIKGRLNL